MSSKKKSGGESNLPVPAGDNSSAKGLMREFFSPVDLDAKLDDKGILEVVDRVHVGLHMAGTIAGQVVVHGGQWLILLKRNLPHGAWSEFLARYFPDLPARTAQRWMAEAKYYLERGQRKSATLALLSASGGAFDEDEGGELDADDLADPRKKAPKPRKELENEVSRLKRRIDARDKRETSLQDQIDDLKDRLARAGKAQDPDEVSDDAPCRSAMAKAVLVLGRVQVFLWEEVPPATLVAEMQDSRALLNMLRRIDNARQRIAERLYAAHVEAFPAKPWSGPDLPDDCQDKEEERGV